MAVCDEIPIELQQVAIGAGVAEIGVYSKEARPHLVASAAQREVARRWLGKWMGHEIRVCAAGVSGSPARGMLE